MKPRPTRWRRCIARQLPETLPLAPQITYSIPVFDTDAMLVEIGLMLEWYLPDRGADWVERSAHRNSSRCGATLLAASPRPRRRPG